ncbi:MAG TPA: heavy metal translocating P-type ATPase [Geminicoccus sp.]|uniref:heavy metal translocating P-type ATPase n=1 Tax=Geminicoccus sp. TaxID=2024832 RepID=UPI002C5837B4|nr:heavy metal translocating P-type ATPase [Geminicoccus sp.]HWL69394.1 heavy metal translocating P-type ATPase [Geminicoccus sp.]
MTSAVQTRFRVQGMDCASCAQKLDNAVRRIEGVTDVAVSVASGTMTVDHAAGAELRPAIQRQVERLGYRASPLAGGSVPAADAAHGACCGHDHHGHHHEHEHAAGDEPHGHLHAHDEGDGPWWRQPRAILTAASGLAFVVAFLLERLVPALEGWIFIPAMLVGLVPIARRALAAAVSGTPFSIEMLMTIAAVGAVAIGAAEEAAAVVFLFMVGEMLEGVAAGRARASIQGLARLVPKTALRLRPDGGTDEIAADQLQPGMVIRVRPGDRIAADGVIQAGGGGIDEAPVTGESVPVTKGPGAPVFAGTISTDGALEVLVQRPTADNTIARIVKLVEEAQERKAPTERLINRFSRWYTPGVVAVAALVAVLPPLLAGQDWHEWIYKGMAILLIGCPCALVISTPAAIAAALSAGARQGLLMKGGSVLEQLRTIDMVAFDKTGTLTEGRPAVTAIVGIDRPEAEVLRLAAALESQSSHPLAKAILARAEGQALPAVTDARALAGKGVLGEVAGSRLFLGSAEVAGAVAPIAPDVAARIEELQLAGNSVSVLVADGSVAGLIGLRDEPRPDARAALAALGAAGVGTVMLTGDHPRAAAAIGQDLGIDAKAGLLPADKQRIVGELQAAGRKVAKVGDGINDAPALAAADVGIAMGSGTDVALETADAAVLHGRVGDVVAMIRLARAAMANIAQNITIALGLKALFLATTVLGITGLWPAILADTGATVLVTANAMRLLRWRPAR